MPPEKKIKQFAIDLVTETVAMIHVSDHDVKTKLKNMPCMVTSYQVLKNDIKLLIFYRKLNIMTSYKTIEMSIF